VLATIIAKKSTKSLDLFSFFFAADKLSLFKSSTLTDVDKNPSIFS